MKPVVLPNAFLEKMDPKDRAKMGKAGLTARECTIIAEAKSEKHLQQQLEALLRRNNIVVIRQRMDKRSTIAEGLPDIMFAVGGIPVAWEAKMPSRNPTAEQEKKHVEMRANGWEVRVIWSYDEGLNHLNNLQLRALPPTGKWPIVNK